MIRLTDILKEDNSFGNVAFGDPNQPVNDEDAYLDFLKLQGKGKKDAEKNTPEEEKLLKAMDKWVNSDGGRSISSDVLTKYLPLIKKGRALFPSIFKPNKADGTPVYRGLQSLSNKLMKQLVKNTTLSDWIPIKGDYFMCKKPIKYKPRSEWQSWTYNPRVAEEDFGGDAILITKQDKNFYFSTKALEILYGEDENEIVHNGKIYSSNVFIALEGGVFYDFQDELHKEKQSFASLGQQLLGVDKEKKKK